MSMMKKAVGYCFNPFCEDKHRGVFILGPHQRFFCPSCRTEGQLEQEEGRAIGHYAHFGRVEVNFNFDPVKNRYRSVAIVRDESVWGKQNYYTLNSPLIRTEKRALSVAEHLLANLQQYTGGWDSTEIPNTNGRTINLTLSKEEFSRELSELAKSWEGLSLTRLQTGRK